MKKTFLTSMIGCLGLLWRLGYETGEYLEEDVHLFDSDENPTKCLAEECK